MFITQPKIFISSTVFDLTNERTAAYNAVNKVGGFPVMSEKTMDCLLYTSDAADDLLCVDLGGRRIIKKNKKKTKKKQKTIHSTHLLETESRWSP